MKDLYKAQVIEDAIKEMQKDEYNLTRLHNEKGKYINIDIQLLEIMRAYYNGKEVIVND